MFLWNTPRNSIQFGGEKDNQASQLSLAELYTMSRIVNRLSLVAEVEVHDALHKHVSSF